MLVAVIVFKTGHNMLGLLKMISSSGFLYIFQHQCCRHSCPQMGQIGSGTIFGKATQVTWYLEMLCHNASITLQSWHGRQNPGP